MHSNETPNKERLTTINQMLESLTYEEASTLRQRFGLTDEKAHPIEKLHR